MLIVRANVAVKNNYPKRSGIKRKLLERSALGIVLTAPRSRWLAPGDDGAFPDVPASGLDTLRSSSHGINFWNAQWNPRAAPRWDHPSTAPSELGLRAGLSRSLSRAVAYRPQVSTRDSWGKALRGPGSCLSFHLTQLVRAQSTDCESRVGKILPIGWVCSCVWRVGDATPTGCPGEPSFLVIVASEHTWEGTRGQARPWARPLWEPCS